MYGIYFIFDLVSLLFITQKSVKAQIIVKIMVNMLPSSENIAIYPYNLLREMLIILIILNSSYILVF